MTIKDWMKQNPNQLPSGFLSPDGKFYFAGFLEHCAIAGELCDWYGYEAGYGSLEKEPLIVLENKGWVHITGSKIFERGLHILFTTDFLTEEQKNSLRPLIENPPLPLSKSSIHGLKYEFPDIEFEGRELV